MSKYVTAAGLAIPSLQKLLDDVSKDQRANIDPDLDTSPDSPMGQINGTVLSPLREAWEVLQIAYNNFDPDAAEGNGLENTSAITGTLRQPARASTFAGTRKASMNLNAATTVPKGTTFGQHDNNAVKFTLDAQVVSTVAGDYLFDATCTTLGPVSCAAGTLLDILTPVAGLNSVTNAFDAILGTDIDSDPQLRTRRETELRQAGGGTVDSLKADVLAIEIDGAQPILSCKVFENVNNYANAYPGPPHSLEVLLYDGLAAATPNDVIAQTIWDSKPGGIRMGGNSSGTAVDKFGASHTVPFSRPTVREIDIKIHVTYTQGKYAGDAAVQAAILARFNSEVSPGSLIYLSDQVAAGMSVVGVKNVPLSTVSIDYHGNPGSNSDLQLAPRDMGDLQLANITITSIAG